MLSVMGSLAEAQRTSEPARRVLGAIEALVA
jgi:hypothetical protein